MIDKSSLIGHYNEEGVAQDPLDKIPLAEYPCFHCEKAISEDDVWTISLNPILEDENGEITGLGRTYFYRLHRTCANSSDAVMGDCEEKIFDLIKQGRV